MNEEHRDIVTLRAMEPEDLDILYKIENDTRLWDVGCTNVPYSRFTLHNYIADSLNDIYTDKQLRLMIENGNGEDVGIIDLMNFEPRHMRAELGIVIMNRYRKNGYASAAIRKIISYARNILHIHQLYAFVGVDNKASESLLQSIGFKKSCRFTDWLYKEGKYNDAILMQYFL